jgi:hypothetical protein
MKVKLNKRCYLKEHLPIQPVELLLASKLFQEIQQLDVAVHRPTQKPAEEKIIVRSRI